MSAQPVSNTLEQNVAKGQAVYDLFLCFNVSFAEDGGVFVSVLSQSKNKDTTKEDCLFINVDTSGASLTFSAFPV